MYWLPRDIIDLGSLDLFPKGEPDETLRSMMARYAVLSSIKNQSALLRTLFRRGCQNDRVYNEDLRVLSLLVAGEEGSENLYSKILHENTFNSLIVNFAENNSNDSISRNTGLVETNFLANRKYCLLCVQHDRDSTGFTYWRRSHQIPGVVCCWKHFTHLHNIRNMKNSTMTSRLLFDTKELDVTRNFSTQKIASEDEIQFSIFAKNALYMKSIRSNIEEILSTQDFQSVSDLAINYFKSHYGRIQSGPDHGAIVSNRLLGAYKVFGSVNSMVSSVMTR